jgi:hypothetical protein
MRLLILAAVVILAQAAAEPQTAPVPAAPVSTLDYAYFRDRVQPIFLKKRLRHARCISCHESGNPRLQELSPGATTWDDEQSRKNFQAWQRVVVPGDPMASRLLMHPLAPEAGGDPFHAGGKHWKSQNDPEWQVLAGWVKTGAPQTTSQAAGGLDFEVYRNSVEPIFLKARQPGEGSGNACFTCHTKIATRLRLTPLTPGATRWTEEQSRSNFAVVSKLIDPADTAKSPVLVHPLATAAGGDAAHTGGKFWVTKDNPEWQAIAAWARAGSNGSAAAPTVTLDYVFFRDRVQPIFLNKRPRHARCISCHESGNPRLQELSAGASTWNEEESHKNFLAWQRVVVPGDPLASRLLMHPLAPEAGGDPFHAGGKHWKSQNDPEWQTLAAWARGQKSDNSK